MNTQLPDIPIFTFADAIYYGQRIYRIYPARTRAVCGLVTNKCEVSYICYGEASRVFIL